MFPLSKDTSKDASKKTLDVELKIKYFKAAGEILAETWLDSIIDAYPVQAAYIDPQECSTDTTNSERWKRVHVQQSQYMLQIVKMQWSELLQILYELPYLFSWEISPTICAIEMYSW